MRLNFHMMPTWKPEMLWADVTYVLEPTKDSFYKIADLVLPMELGGGLVRVGKCEWRGWDLSCPDIVQMFHQILDHFNSC